MNCSGDHLQPNLELLFKRCGCFWSPPKFALCSGRQKTNPIKRRWNEPELDSNGLNRTCETGPALYLMTAFSHSLACLMVSSYSGSENSSQSSGSHSEQSDPWQNWFPPDRTDFPLTVQLQARDAIKCACVSFVANHAELQSLLWVDGRTKPTNRATLQSLSDYQSHFLCWLRQTGTLRADKTLHAWENVHTTRTHARTHHVW